MAFLTLSDGTTTLTVRVKSNAAGQEYQEHGADRFRVFSGEYRLTLRGRFRHWSLSSKYLSSSDYLALVALLTSNTLPLTASGDLMDGESVKVIPNLKSASPTQTAQGFDRTVSFELDETTNTETATASPWMFLRSGSGYWNDFDKTTPAGVDDDVAVWADSTGNGRDVTSIFNITDHYPLVQQSGQAIRFGGTISKRGGFETPSLSGFTEGEIMLAVRRESNPADDSEGALFQLGAQGDGNDYLYKASDGHIWSTFGSHKSVAGYDCGAPGIDLTGRFHVVDILSSATEWCYRLDNGILRRETSGLVVGFDQAAPRFGESVLGDHFNGWIKHLVLFNYVLTTAQRASWYAFLNGDTDDPPVTP